jgi:threonine dehydrogenase-like Zn-dependent dehydrogenase
VLTGLNRVELQERREPAARAGWVVVVALESISICGTDAHQYEGRIDTVFGVGGNGGRGQYERAQELVRTGRLDVARMVTHRFALADVAQAFAVAAGKTEGVIKVVLHP